MAFNEPEVSRLGDSTLVEFKKFTTFFAAICHCINELIGKL